MLFVQCSLHICLLQENIWTVPNLLSLLRISAAPLLGWCVLGGHHVAAVSIFVLAGLSDWVRRSVYSATNWDQHSYMQNAPLSPPPSSPHHPLTTPHHPLITPHHPPTLNFCFILLKIDGFIARNVPGQLSSIGSVLDPLADKLLACVLFVALTKVGYLPRESHVCK